MGRASDGQPDRRPEVHEHVLAELDLLLEDVRALAERRRRRTDRRAPASRIILSSPVRIVPIRRCTRSYVKVSPFRN